MPHPLLLAIDIGNTNIVLGIFSGSRLLNDWRLRTTLDMTADELFITLSSLVGSDGRSLSEFGAVAISCVVPSLLYSFDVFCRRYLNTKALVVGIDTPTEISVCIDNPRELGADRLVNAVAAFHKYRRDLIIVDFGTATTFDCISGKGEYLGGVIAPGIMISCEALFAKTAKLPRTAIFARPESIIAKNTVAAMNAGVVYGYAGMVDGVVSRMKKELGIPLKLVATGGLAPLIVSECRSIRTIEPYLTLEGLRIIYDQNR